MIEINPQLHIPEEECSFQTSRSSGPGGQNVNKLETRVTLNFEVATSSALDDFQKERISQRLATRINKAGFLRVTSQKHRTQAANRDAAVARFAELLAAALLPEKPRKKTRKEPAGARRRRVEAKRRRSETKRLRSSPKHNDPHS